MRLMFHLLFSLVVKIGKLKSLFSLLRIQVWNVHESLLSGLVTCGRILNSRSSRLKSSKIKVSFLFTALMIGLHQSGLMKVWESWFLVWITMMSLGIQKILGLILKLMCKQSMAADSVCAAVSLFHQESSVLNAD